MFWTIQLLLKYSHLYSSVILTDTKIIITLYNELMKHHIRAK